MSTVTVAGDGSVAEALQGLRLPTGYTADYVVLGFPDNKSTVLCVVATGFGGIDAVRPHLTEDRSLFVLLRYSVEVNGHPTVKFALIDWTPSSLPPVRKALLSTLRGSILEICSPYAISVDWSDKNDIDPERIVDRIAAAAGVKSNVVDKSAVAAGAQKPSASAPATSSARAAPRDLKLADAVQFSPDVVEAVKTVRLDTSSTDWMTCSYTSSATVGDVRSGSNGFDGFLEQLSDDVASYSFLRFRQVVNNVDTVKFVFVSLIPAATPPVQRAKYSTHRGLALQTLQPFHYEFAVDSKADLSLDRIKKKMEELVTTVTLAETAGRFSFVHLSRLGSGLWCVLRLNSNARRSQQLRRCLALARPSSQRRASRSLTRKE